jgi:hypothetical protein
MSREEIDKKGNAMTEAEWAGAADPHPMLQYLRGQASDRKLRLFAVVCCRRVWRLLDGKQDRQVVKTAEDHADGGASAEDLAGAHAAARTAAEGRRWHVPSDVSSASAWTAAGAAALSAAKEAGLAAAEKAVLRPRAPGTPDDPGNNPWDNAWNAAEKVAFAAQAALLRDVFGNPFHPIAISAAILAWNDRTIPKLAQAIYEERQLPSGRLDRARLAVLADALEEAGCDNEELIQHCRSAGPHVRGCWAVDLLLGKQ